MKITHNHRIVSLYFTIFILVSLNTVYLPVWLNEVINLNTQQIGLLIEAVGFLKIFSNFLITTHYLEEAEALCEDVAIINKGEIVINGNIKKLVKKIDKKILKVYSENLKTLPSSLKNIGFKKYNRNEISIDYKPSKHSIDELISEVVKYNIKIKDISIKDTTLEDLFKEITR